MNKTPQLLYYNLGDKVIAFSSTRHGGVGEGVYGEFNINTNCGDRIEHVEQNKSLLAKELNISKDNIIIPTQTHQTSCCIIDNSFFALNSEQRQNKLSGIDAVVTSQKGVCIGVSTADCIPILLYDDAKQIVAAIHAGWRGTVQHIVSKTIEVLKTDFNCCPNDIKAIIGPGISLKNFEVGDEVYNEFQGAGFPIKELACRFPAKKALSNDEAYKWHIDLKGCNTHDLILSGVKSEHIYDAQICTYDSSDDFFSARKFGIKSGRIYNGIFLK